MVTMTPYLHIPCVYIYSRGRWMNESCSYGLISPSGSARNSMYDDTLEIINQRVINVPIYVYFRALCSRYMYVYIRYARTRKILKFCFANFAMCHYNSVFFSSRRMKYATRLVSSYPAHGAKLVMFRAFPLFYDKFCAGEKNAREMSKI